MTIIGPCTADFVRERLLYKISALYNWTCRHYKIWWNTCKSRGDKKLVFIVDTPLARMQWTIKRPEPRVQKRYQYNDQTNKGYTVQHNFLHDHIINVQNQQNNIDWSHLNPFILYLPFVPSSNLSSPPHHNLFDFWDHPTFDQCLKVHKLFLN